MKKFMLMGILAVFALGVTGCSAGEDSTETAASGITVLKDGTIESVIVEDFAESYYSVEGLSEMIMETITEYSKRSSDADIELKTCELIEETQQVRVVMQFDSDETYAGFQQETFFAGTVQEAYEAGVLPDLILQAVSKEAKNGDTIAKRDLLEMGERHIVIYEQNSETDAMAIHCFGTILYTSEGLQLLDSKSVQTQQGQAYHVMVFK